MKRSSSSGLLHSMALVAVAQVPMGCGGEISGSAAVDGPRTFASASIEAPAGAVCQLHPEGNADPALALPVLVDEDGVARFQAVRASLADAAQRLALECTDATGHITSYAVDLLSEATFRPRPFDAARAGASFRPALAGDPSAYSDLELIQAGYGLRPDAHSDPDGYAHWLRTVSRPARRLRARPGLAPGLSVRQPSPTVSSELALATTIGFFPPWVGAVMNGSAPYLSSQATFFVPRAVPGGDRTVLSGVSFWNGLGGYNSADRDGLLRGGVAISTTPTAATYSIFRDYCCGGVSPNNYLVAAFAPAPSDPILSQHWYCDAFGAAVGNGAYGCSFVYDEEQGAVFSCVLPNDPTCPSYPALPSWPQGQSAEFIAEPNSWLVFTDFSETVSMQGSAQKAVMSGPGPSVTLATDPMVTQIPDFTQASTTLHADIALPDRVNFSVSCVPNVTSCAGRCGPVANGCGGVLNCPDCQRCTSPRACCIQAGGVWVGGHCT